MKPLALVALCLAVLRPLPSRTQKRRREARRRVAWLRSLQPDNGGFLPCRGQPGQQRADQI